MNCRKRWLAILLSVILITGSVSGPVFASEAGEWNSDTEITLERPEEHPFDAAEEESTDTSEDIVETMNSQEDADEESSDEKEDDDSMTGLPEETSDDTNDEWTDLPAESVDLSENELTDSLGDPVYEEDDLTDISDGEIKKEETVEEDSDSIEKADDIETDDMPSDEQKSDVNTDGEEKLIEDQPDEETVSEERSNDVLQDDDFLYYVSGSNATIIGYTGSQSELVIPDKIGDYLVTEIGDQAFYGCSSVTSIRLPESITFIGYRFIQGTGITSITIPKSVISCGNSWYDGPLAGSSVEEVIFEKGMKEIPSYCCSTGSYTSYIESVSLPGSLTSIGYYAFYGSASLKEINIPKEVSVINPYAFYGCSSLKSVRLNPNDTILNTANNGKAKEVIIKR